MKIKSIKEGSGDRVHLDITTEKNHNFFANKILTHNCNLPARNVIIVGVHRGITQVDELDIIQMCGRAGRYGIDDEGHVYLVIPDGSTENWKYTLKNPRPVNSILNDHQILAFHLLSEIETKEIETIQDVFKWYSRSLAAKQNLNPFEMEDVKGLMSDLEMMEMIGYSGINPFITGLGRVSAWLYYSPYDIYAWYRNFQKLFVPIPQNQNVSPTGEQIPFDDTTISWALGDIPNNNLGYIPKDISAECEEWQWTLRNRGIKVSDAVSSVVAVYKCLIGEENKGLLNTIKRNIIFDIDRIVQAIKLIDQFYAKWDKQEFWDTLPIRIKYGIPAEMVGLTKLSGIGGKRAKKMWEKGIKTLDDVADKNNKKMLANLFVPTFVNKIQSQAREMIGG